MKVSLIIFWLIFPATLMAQEIIDPLIPHITIEGDLPDTILQSKLNKKRHIILRVSTFGSNYLIAPYKIYDFTGKSFFKLKLPSLTDFTYINFSIGETKDVSVVDNSYMFEAGDSLKIKISGNNYSFYGKGADKLNCQHEMNDLQFRDTENDLKLLNDNKYDKYYHITNKRRDSIFEQQIQIVNKYSIRLGKKMTEIMLANAYGLRYASNLSAYVMNSQYLPDVFLAFLKSETYRGIDMSLSLKIDPENLNASPIYCNFLLEKIIVDNLLEGKSNRIRLLREMPIIVFNVIKNNYSGLLREKLFVMYFFKYKNYSDAYLYLDEALNYVRNSEIQSILLEIKNTKASGAAFFPFELEDKNGATVRLSDLNGKVVVFDFWYTGCENCIILHDGMKPVVEKFKNNPKVEFVSISIDKDKLSWLKSVASGKYTNPDGLNLYTNGLGLSHPLIENYRITGYPKLFVIKNGKIITAGPPRPGSSDSEYNVAARNAFISLIQRALDDNSYFP